MFDCYHCFWKVAIYRSNDLVYLLNFTLVVLGPQKWRVFLLTLSFVVSPRKEILQTVSNSVMLKYVISIKIDTEM